uniref:Negative elongation factor E n=1 Tax=Heterorhabditis bacteriophora TaxID=37862 RepID=A0A1I7WJ79_HETBA
MVGLDGSKTEKKAAKRSEYINNKSFSFCSLFNVVSTNEIQGSSKNNWKRRDMENRGPTIYIRGYAMEYDCISHTFEKFGRIVRINIDDHQKSAFVQFSSESEAEAAIKEMDGNVMNATQIHVSFARHQNSQSDGDGINSSGLSRRNKEKRASSSTQGSSFDSSTSEPPPVSVSLSAWTKATSKDTGTIDLELLKRRMVEYDEEDLFN